MSSEERSAWIELVLAIGTFATYLVIVLRRAAVTPLPEVEYVPALLWTIGVSIVASIAVHILAGMFFPKDAGKKDQRDKEIYRRGQYAGHWILVLGALAALGLALAETDHFWIANVIYLAFVLSMILSSVVRIIAYRRGM